MKALIYFVLLLLLVKISAAQHLVVTGKVVSNGKGIPFAHVLQVNTTHGSVADDTGYFKLKIDQDKGGTLVCSSLGFHKKVIEIPTSKTNIDLGKIELKPSLMKLDEVTVTGGTRAQFIKASPVKIDVIKTDAIRELVPASNLMETFGQLNGVQEVVACGVCYTNAISINSLPGPYTAVLLDGIPMYGNLAAVYGLNGIPTPLIDRLEVIKGPQSTLYGSEAVAGVVNVITKDPSMLPTLSIESQVNSNGQSSINALASFGKKSWKAMIGGNQSLGWSFMDRNEDGFGDLVLYDRYSAFQKFTITGKQDRQFTLASKFYFEDRRNGVEEFVVGNAHGELRGNDSIYGESIYTKRAEVYGRYDFGRESGLHIDYAYSWHHQNSYYGSIFYKANQQIAFINGVWNRKYKHFNMAFGGGYRLNVYDDNTVATQTRDGETNQVSIQSIPGVFGEMEYQATPVFLVALGGRLDHYNEHGLIGSPRFNMKYELGSFTTARLNTGTGFRIVNLFTEDHAFVSGQRVVEITEQIRPEQSINATFNLNHIYTIFDKQNGQLDVDLYYTHFQNQIIPDYSTPGIIKYENLSGYSFTRGVSIGVTHSLSRQLGLGFGGNFNEAIEVSEERGGNNSYQPIPFSTNYSGYANLNWRLPSWKMIVAYSVSYTGVVNLPEVYDVSASGSLLQVPRATNSQPFALHTIQVTKEFDFQLQLFAGVQNLFDYLQRESPLVGFQDPNHPVGFSPYFDTNYSYATLNGRNVFFGLRWYL